MGGMGGEEDGRGVRVRREENNPWVRVVRCADRKRRVS